MLAGAGLSDHSMFAHAPGQQRLAEYVVDLVRTGVVQVLTLEQNPHAATVLGEARYLGERGRASGVVAAQAVQFGPKLRIGIRRSELALELVEGRDQGFGDVAPPEDVEMAGSVRQLVLFHGPIYSHPWE